MFRQLHMVAASDLRLFSLLLFFIVFVAVLTWSFLVRRREDWNSLARLPLEGDRPAPGEEGTP
jgi:cbb3-type cytochrome oxidase subunit 3